MKKKTKAKGASAKPSENVVPKKYPVLDSLVRYAEVDVRAHCDGSSGAERPSATAILEHSEAPPPHPPKFEPRPANGHSGRVERTDRTFPFYGYTKGLSLTNSGLAYGELIREETYSHTAGALKQDAHISLRTRSGRVGLHRGFP